MSSIHGLLMCLQAAAVFGLPLLYCVEGGSQEPLGKNTVGQPPERSKGNMDPERLVSALENQNPSPMIVGEVPRQQPLFAKDYNWQEEARVRKAIQTLIDHTEEAWLAIIDHLDDTRYCITFEHDQSVANYSIGDVCFILLAENLTAAYLPYIPVDEGAFFELRRPGIVPFNRVKSWCREQHEKGKPLYELQIDTCEWAIGRIREMAEIPEAERRESVVRIQKAIEQLRATKKPALIKSVTKPEFRVPYSQKRAEEIRARLTVRAG